MKIPMSFAASLVLLSANAVAEHPRPHDQHSRGPIAIAEIEAEIEQRFVQADTDGDGLITAEEFDGAEIHRRGPRGRMGRRFHSDAARHSSFSDDMEARVFAEMDSDGDGALSPDEFSERNRRAARVALMKQQMFSTLDANDDGVITLDEFDNRTRRLMEMDTDGDGEVSRDELRGSHRARSRGAS